MLDDPAATEADTLEGALERITFHNEETGYTVAAFVPEGRATPVTVVGRIAAPAVGTSLRLEGRWTTHARYGRQFEIAAYSERLPGTLDGIRRYLGSGMIQGVGPVTAERIVERFGTETLDVIDREPERLAEVPGVGKVRSAQIARAWREQRRITDLMIFLQSHGVGTGLAVRIYRRFGDAAGAVVRQDPYRLAREVAGIGFQTADRIARRLGLAVDDPRRMDAGVLHTLSEMADQGHVYAPRDTLAHESVARLAVEGAAPGGGEAPTEAGVAAAVDRLALRGEIRVEVVGPGAQDAVYRPDLHAAEADVAQFLRALLRSEETRLGAFRSVAWPTALDWVDRRSPYPLAESQREAVQAALTHQVTVVTGGPGTGKTTIVRAVLQLLGARGGSVALAAPTGRAAKRLAESTGIEARTIHRLLEFKPSEGWRFLRDEQRPLEADLVVIDEVSMIDVELMAALVRAIAPGTHLLLVGDVDQLPSVGPGSVLRDVIDSGVVPTVVLQQIFRQAEDSGIVANAHRINAGEMPVFDSESRDFFLFKAEDGASAARWVVDIVKSRIPKRFGLDPLRDVQVLSPMHRGAAGVSALNAALQEALNPPAEDRIEIALGARTLRVGDKVMQTRNDYEREVFNGDLGMVIGIDRVERRIDVAFDGRAVGYPFTETDAIIHAFACSTHKSQGAEYPAVVMAVLPEHHLLLQRNLLYTGVTRARRLCVLVGAPRAIEKAVRNDKVARRYTRLSERLRGEA